MLVAGFGVAATVALIAAPVRASFADDPILRLQGFDRRPVVLPTNVDCGAAGANLDLSPGAGSLYAIARDDACERAGRRRVTVAVATGFVVVLLGLVGVVEAGRRDDDELPRAPRVAVR